MSTDRPFSLADAVKFGLFAGIAGVLIALVGMLEAFSKAHDHRRRHQHGAGNDAGCRLCRGRCLLPAKHSALIAGSLSPAGMIAGAVTALCLAVLALLIVPLHLRDIFVNATPQLVKLLMPFDLTGIAGAAVLVGLGALTGLVAAAVTYLPPVWRNSLLISLSAVILIALLEDVFVVVVPKNVGKFVYKSNGLTLVGAISIFVIVFALAFVWLANRDRVSSRIDSLPPKRRTDLQLRRHDRSVGRTISSAAGDRPLPERSG